MGLLRRIAGWVSPAARLGEAKRLADAGEWPRAFPLFARAAGSGLAEAQYRVVLAKGPHPLASFNLAVVLEDQGRTDEAIAAYQATLAADPTSEDSYFNLARIYEQRGERVAALRALRTYRALTQKR